MDVRLANTWRLTVNEKKFIETALASDLRVDGRSPLEYRKVAVKFGKEDGAAEVQLGLTHVMAFVTAQLVKPFRDRPNEGSLSIFTEFSPMADPSFEPGRPTESSVELGRVIDRGLRESRAIDTESLCVLAGELVWAIRIDLHMLDNGGNLVDAANIAALAALMTFRRPECTLGGEDGKEVIVHLPEVREPLPLIVHHLPISVAFGFFRVDGKMVVDPTHSEEAVMGGRMTVTVNANGDICAIQKAGGEGVPHSVIMRCLRLASRNAETITTKIKDAVEAYNTERALRKIKRHPAPIPSGFNLVNSDLKDRQHKSEVTESSRHHMEILKLASEETGVSQISKLDTVGNLSQQVRSRKQGGNADKFFGGPSSWDPYPKVVNPESLKASLASRGTMSATVKQTVDEDVVIDEKERDPSDVSPSSLVADGTSAVTKSSGEKTLKDAFKPQKQEKKAVINQPYCK